MKRILLLFSALMLSCIALWAHDVEIGGIYYNLDKTNKTAGVTYRGDDYDYYDDEYTGSVTIPETITYHSEIYSVTSIGYNAFYGCSRLTSVTIPNSVTSIGKEAFYNCSGLTSIIWNAKNCEDFSSYTYSPFDDIRSSITSFTFGNEVEHIPAYLCDGMSKLTEITIPNSVTSIGSGAFSSCSGLTSITIPNSVTSIGWSAFSWCSGLTKVNYLGTVDKWVEINFVGDDSNPTYYAKDLYINNELLTDVKITTADSIKKYAFYTCKSIKSVEIGESVTTIASGAFHRCSGLTSVTIPNSVTSIGEYAFSRCSGLTSVTIGNNVTSIDYYAFGDCSGLTSVTIPNSVTSIGSTAFYNCSRLTSVIWNAKNYKDFSSYSSSPFYDIRSNITSFTFGNEIEHIPAYLCYGMENLKEVTIGKSVTSIGSYEFSGCSGLTKVNYLGTVDKWLGIDFKDSYSNPTRYAKDLYINNELLTDVKITTADSIKKYAFYNCQSIKSVEIGESVTSIGSSAFSGCSGLTSVIWNAKNCEDFSLNSSSPFHDTSSSIFTFGNEVEHIPAYLCYGMYNLKEVTIPNSVTSIGSDAFYNCSGLTKVNYLGTVDKWVEIDFEDSDSNPTYYAKDLYINNELLTDVKITTADSIKNYAFYNCQSIKSVEIGESVTSIGEDAFSGCDKLRKVTAYPTTVPSVYENSFAHYNAALYVPCDVYDDYFFDDVFGTFKVTECISAEEVDAPEKVEIEVDEDNNANVIWPSTDGAKKYELEISKDGEVFCTLLFNENGQLTSIDFGNRSASVGFQFTVTGLDGASKYAYSMVAMDKKGNELQSYKGTFTTNGYVPGPGEEDEPTSITETLDDANITVSGGTISADADFSIYNTIGQDVTSFNGSLQPGVYVVALGEDRVKIMIK